MKDFDPAKLILVTPNKRKSEPFDLRFLGKSKKFRFSSSVWAQFGLNTNGVSMFTYPGGSVVISVQSEETSQILKTRKNSETKGKEFTSSELANLLELTNKQADFSLTILSKTDKVTHLLIGEYNGASITSDVDDETPEKSGEDVEEEVAEEVDETISLETDAFAEPDDDEAEPDADDEDEEEPEPDSKDELVETDPLGFLDSKK